MNAKRFFLIYGVFALFTAVGCVEQEPCNLCDDLDAIERRLTELENTVTRLEEKMLSGVLIESVTEIEGGWRITFTGGEPPYVDIFHGVTPEGGELSRTPQLEVRKNADGTTTMWVNYGDGKGWVDTGTDLTGPGGATPRIGSDGYWWIGDVRLDARAEGVPGPQGPEGPQGTVVGIVDNGDGTVTITMNDSQGTSYTFEKASTAERLEIMTVGAITVTEGNRFELRFRVNPSTAWVPTTGDGDMTKWELDGVETRAGYVNASPNFTLEKLVPSGAGEGDYTATISFDTATENAAEYILALVLNTGGDAEPVLVSSAPFVVLPGEPLRAAPPANCYIVPYGDSVIIDLMQITNEVAAGFRAEPRVAPTDDVTMELLWADRQEDILTNVQITRLTPPNKGTKSMFSVKSNWASGGNAIVAARVGGEIVWSWQIWLTDYDPDTQNHTHDTGGSTSEATPDAGKELVFMDRNLGAWGGTGGVETMGMLYQWGRKDPFPGNFNGYPWFGGGSGEPPVYTLAEPTGTDEAIAVVNASVSSGIDFATANPMTFITNGRADTAPYSEHSWYSYEGGGPRNLWVDTPDAGATLLKTVYDPCPPGWRVPAEGSHSILMGGSDDGESPFGVTMNAGPYFPYAGMRRQDVGRPVMDFVPTCWFGQSYFDHTAYSLYSAPPSGAPAYQGDALPVRCVKVTEE